MRRKLVTGLLAAGAILGFASGFAHLKHHKDRHEEALLQKVEDTCYTAAKRGAAEALDGEETFTASFSDRHGWEEGAKE